MKFSELFALGRTQGGLDFVDIDVEDDIPVYLDPTAIRVQDGDWSTDAVVMLTTFFQAVLSAVAAKDKQQVRHLMIQLGEPNETHLGQSKGTSRGRGLGPEGLRRLSDALADSRAAQSGLLEDLEDSALFVRGIGRDITSDMCTGVLRGPLAGYTKQCCDYYGIDTEPQFCGPIWDPVNRDWLADQPLDLPRGPAGPIILVPKSVVRHSVTYDSSSYYRGYLVPLLEENELSRGTALVTTLKNGQQKVFRSDLEAKYGTGKDALVVNTLQFRNALDKYRISAREQAVDPIGPAEFPGTNLTDSPSPPDLEKLLKVVTSVQPGSGGATLYHRNAEELCTALFYPDLGNMRLEEEINQGRKRIDIAYDNLARGGVFWWLHQRFHSAVVPVECKNYTDAPDNPAVDQIAMRLGDLRGRVGILLYRGAPDKNKVIQRCRDVAMQGNGIVIPLDDEDLTALVHERQSDAISQRGYPLTFLRKRVNDIIS